MDPLTIDTKSLPDVRHRLPDGGQRLDGLGLVLGGEDQVQDARLRLHHRPLQLKLHADGHRGRGVLMIAAS